MSMKRYELTKEQWERIKPLLPPEETGKRGRPRKDNRIMLNGMLWIVRSGAQWRELPETYGPWQSIYRGFSDLQKDAQQIVLTKSDNNVDTSQTAHLPAIHALLESYQQDMQNVTATFSNLTVQQLDQAVQWMQEGKCLYLLGLRMAFTLSYYAYASWGRMRRNIRLVHVEGLEYPEDMLNMKQGDVCVCFAFPRYVADTLRLLKWMRKQGVRVILITGARKSILWDMGDRRKFCVIDVPRQYENLRLGLV